MESFSKNVKDQLREAEVKKKCCRFTEDDMRDLEKLRTKAGQSSLADEIGARWQRCLCDSCKTVFLRYMFIIFGSVTNPELRYHLDMSFTNEDERDLVAGFLAEKGFDFGKTMRRSRYVAYIKDSGAIEDFLVSIGAQNAAFELMNSKIVREFRNSVNRQVNCDTANIEKQLSSVKKYTDAIHKLKECGEFDKLSEEIRHTAELRLENEQLSLADLGKMLTPPVTKSGIKHRLDKILAIAEDITE